MFGGKRSTVSDENILPRAPGHYIGAATEHLTESATAPQYNMDDVPGIGQCAASVNAAMSGEIVTPPS